MRTLRATSLLVLACVAGTTAACRQTKVSLATDMPGTPALVAPPQRARGAPVEVPVERLRLPSLVGKMFSDAIPFPGSATYRGGWMIDPADTALNIGVQERTAGRRRILVLDSVIRRSRTGRPTWLIVDAIRLPDVGDSLALSTRCGYEQAEDLRRLIALVPPVDAYEVTDIRAAWRVNRSAQRFESASLIGLRCWNEEWGQ